MQRSDTAETTPRRRHRLAQLREIRGFSQEKFAELVDVERTTVARWESGETTPLPSQRPKLAEALDVSLALLAEILDDFTELTEPSATGAGSGGHDELSGGYEIVELDRRFDIDIDPDGWATLTDRYEILNNGIKPFVRFSREVWFEHTSGFLTIEAIGGADRNIAIQRVHDTPNLAKFACLFSPAVEPGERAVVGYTCTGGRFRDHLYWRQSIHHFTGCTAIHVRHRGAERLLDYSAVEEQTDGSEAFATDGVEWAVEGSDVLLTLTRRRLRPSQSVTLRWSVEKHAERKPDREPTRRGRRGSLGLGRLRTDAE